MDINIPDLPTTQRIIEGWATNSITSEQLAICQELIPTFFNKFRFPKEEPNALFLARASLYIAIENRLNEINLIPA